jgi:DNA-directed RNA polymerase specialized sigma24 family protein
MDWRGVARFQSGSIHVLPRVHAKWDFASRRWARLSLEFDYRVHRSFNPLRLLTKYSGTPMLSDSPPPGKQLDSASGSQVGWARHLPQWASVLQSTFKRIRVCRVPPRWSVRDWSEELKAISLAAAWHALGDFDPKYGVPLPVFLRERILASALTRYRQEWAYSVRCTEEIQNEYLSCSPLCRLPAHDSFVEAVARLSASDRWLVEQIFWHGKSEAEVSKHLGISQQAVNKRKKSVLRALRQNL